MAIKNKKLNPGDYVQIKKGIHDEQMPLDGRRDGLVVELLGHRKDQAVIMFHNNAFLKFHTSQLTLLEKLCTNR